MSTRAPSMVPHTAPSLRLSQPPHLHQRRRWQRRADAFSDARPEARLHTRRKLSPPATLGIACAYVAGVCLSALHPASVVIVLGTATVSGSWLDRRRHRQLLLPTALLLGAIVAVMYAHDVVTMAVYGVGALLSVVVFGALPRIAVRAAITAARSSERERSDAEVLRLIDDARRLRALAGRSDADDVVAPEVRDIGAAVAQRDRLYRLLGLIERSLKDVSCAALYAVDSANDGAGLTLIDQRHRDVSDASDDTPENHPRLLLGARGVGPAGLVGLASQKKTALRVVDSEGKAVGAHRMTGEKPRSALCVPLMAKDVCTGVIVVDRVVAVPFSAADEAFVRGIASEVQDGLAMDTLIDDLDSERRRVTRVFDAARALATTARKRDVQRVAMEIAHNFCAGAALVSVRDGEFVVDISSGVLAPLMNARGVLDDTSFVARCLREHVPLPHTSLDRAQPRPLLNADCDVGAVGDLRAIPLHVADVEYGVLVIATEADKRLTSRTTSAAYAIADVIALSLSSAAAFDAIEQRATTDGLTGVWNRRTLDDKLKEAAQRARRSGAPLTVIMTDVDHFKSVNDTWGHKTGDDVLKGIAKVLADNARETDIVGRLGGEEFVVVCEATDLPGATVVAERMRSAIKGVTFDTDKGPLSVTSSFGVAIVHENDLDGHVALENADKQLYRAKAAGRDRVMREPAPAG